MLMERSERNAARAEWLEARRAGIGSSDAPAIVMAGQPDWKGKSLIQLYAEKRGLRPIGDRERDYFEWGHRLEPVVAAKYEEETNRTTFDPGDFHIERHHAAEWMIATPDRIITDYADPPPPLTLPLASGEIKRPGVLELKTASAWNRKDWTDEPPLAYQVQVQHQLAVTGHLWGSIAVLIGGQTFLWTDIARNDEFIARLMTQEHAFYQRVLRGDAPDPDGSADASDALDSIYPKEERDAIALSGDALQWDKERLEAMKVIETQAAIKLECENRLKNAIGVHAVGVLPNGARYTWKTGARKGYVVKPGMSRRFLRSEAKA
jgi:putative phage-type endonuclease